MQAQTQAKATSVPTDSPSVSFGDGVLQGCFKQRAEPATGMPVLYDVPRLPEQSLDPATHASIKSRSGRDFSRVPIHTALPMMVQAKLTIGQPGDKYEREADRVADLVMSMPEPCVQHQVEPDEEEPIQTKPLADQITPLVQRQVEQEEEEGKETLSLPIPD